MGVAHGFERKTQGKLFFDVARIILETLDELGYEVSDKEFAVNFDNAVNAKMEELKKEKDQNKAKAGRTLIGTKFIEDQVKDGWISGGSIYFEMTRLNDKLTQLLHMGIEGKSYNASHPGKLALLSPYIDNKMKQTNSRLENWSKQTDDTNKRLDNTKNGSGDCSDSATACLNMILKKPSNIIRDGIQGVFSRSGNEFKHEDRLDFLNRSASPIVMAANLGSSLMWAGDVLVVMAIYAAIPGTSLPAIAVGSLGPFMIISSMVLILLLALVFFGATLAFYIPMVPYIIWTGGIVSWLVTVAEAMIIAPIWAISFLSPEGEGFTGERARQGWLLVLSVFLRPTLMLFGLFFAAAISYAVFALISASFGTVYSQVYQPGFSNLGLLYWVLGAIGRVAIFTIIVLTTLNTIYSLIHIIPDRVLRWIGGGDAPLGDMGAEQQSKQAFGAVISSGSSAAQSTVANSQTPKKPDKKDPKKPSPDGAGETSAADNAETQGTNNPAQNAQPANAQAQPNTQSGPQDMAAATQETGGGDNKPITINK